MHPENKTLVILTPGFPQSEADTTCLPMQQNFVKALNENYPRLKIIILSFQYPYFTKTYKWYDTTVISFNGKNKGGLAKLLLRRKLNAALQEINSSNKIVGILSFWYNECAWVGKKFADKNNLKHYSWLLGQDARQNNRYPKSLQLAAGELIALSDFLQDEFEKNHGIKPQHVITPGINTKHSGTAVKKRDIDILGAGSLIPLKQYDIFIQLIFEIKKQQPAVKAMLVGNGPEKEKLQNLILKYGLQENIMLTGEVSYDEVLEMMHRTKVFLHPSAYEGFSGVCQEALYSGARVISFCRAMKQEIEHWHIVHNKDEMKQKALEVLQQPGAVYKSVAPFLMNDTVKKMMHLFSI